MKNKKRNPRPQFVSQAPREPEVYVMIRRLPPDVEALRKKNRPATNEYDELLDA